MKKYCRVGQATDDDIVRHMRFACLLTRATNTYSEYVILIVFFFRGNRGFANAPHCYVCTYIGFIVFHKECIGHKPCHFSMALFVRNICSEMHM